MIRRLFRMLVLSLVLQPMATPVMAVTINTTDLPMEIQTCISNSNCIFAPESLTSIDDYNNSSMFIYQEFDGVSINQKFLVRYSLTDAYQISFDIVTPSSGYIWLEGNTQYNNVDPLNQFSLHLDQISPLPHDLSGSNVDGVPINLGLTNTDLLAGNASWSLIADESDGYIEHVSGNLVTDGLPSSTASFCLALGGTCGADASFNTVYLQFFDSGSTLDLLPAFNTSDSRSTLYQQRLYHDDQLEPFAYLFEEQIHSVQVVPIPGAVWLLGSGLLGLVGMARHNKPA